MHISCPYCTSIFDVRRHDLGDDGKRVQCGICEHEWFIDPSFYIDTPETDADLSVDMHLDDSAPPSLSYGISDGLSLDQLPSGAMPSLARLYREEAKRTRLSKSMITVSWIILIIATMTTLGYGILARDNLVERFPALSKIYHSINLDVDEYTNVSAFAVTDTNISVQFRNLERILNINGAITNIDNVAHIIPTLYVSLSNVFGKEIYSIRIDTPQELLESGESVTFEHTIFNFPDNSADIIMLFLNRSENLYTTIGLDSQAIVKMILEEDIVSRKVDNFNIDADSQIVEPENEDL